MNSLPQVFRYEGQRVRTLIDESGEPWFVANQIEQLRLLPIKPSEYCGYIYAIEYGQNIKIGQTADAYKRMKALIAQARNYGDICVGRMAISQPHTNYAANERVLHAHWKALRIRGELFRVDLDRFISDSPSMGFLDETARLQAKTERGLQFFKSVVRGPDAKGASL